MLQTKHEKETEWRNMMVSMLHHNVPRFIDHIKKRGGVNKEEWNWLQYKSEPPDYLGNKKSKKRENQKIDNIQDLIERADEYLLFTNNIEVFENSIFILVKALAIMSFVPGGIRFFGLHFCSQIDGFVVMENDTPET